MEGTGPVNVVLLGAPGAGKGTQAQHIRKAARIPHISTGDILRAAAAEGTQVGLRARSYMDRGELVPDEVVVAIVAERMARPDCRPGWLLDGFPRTSAQAEALDRTIWERGLRKIDFVLYLRASPEVVVERLSARRVCPNTECGAAYHLKFMPPKEDELCDRCQTKLIQREDDKPETVPSRLETYERLTAGLVARYREAGLLVEIDASGTPEEVAEHVLEALGPIPEPPAEPVEVPPGNASAAPEGASAGASAQGTAG
jgi:adenylate kinase